MEWREYARKITDPDEAKFKDDALDGIRVLDISIASPSAMFASSILAELGAEVIKIEPPGGDPLREVTPFGEFYLRNTGLDFLVETRNKMFVTLNIEREEGREILKRMVARSDIIIESYPPGWMDERGLGYRHLKEINPGIIYLAFSSYGHFGPKARDFASVPDSNLLGLAMSGYMFMTKELPEAGEPYNLPTAPGFWMAYYYAGMWGACGVLLALIYRNRTGEGQMIDVTSTEAITKIGMHLIYPHAFGEPLEGFLPLDAGVFSYAFYEIKDGYAFASGYTDANFKALVTQIEAEHLLEKYPTVFDRIPLEKQKQAYRDVQEAIRKFTFRELAERMVKWKEEGREGVAIYAKVMSPKEVLEDDFWWKKKVFRIYNDHRYKNLLIPNTPWRLSETPYKLKWLGKEIGENNYFVYHNLLGFGREDLEDLKREGII